MTVMNGSMWWFGGLAVGISSGRFFSVIIVKLPSSFQCEISKGIQQTAASCFGQVKDNKAVMFISW